MEEARRPALTVAAWAPAVVWMTAIRIAASLPAPTRSAALHSGGRLADLPGAVAHVAVYGVLALAFLLALRNSPPEAIRRWALPGAFLLATAYGTVDEYHQTLMPAHGGWPEDIGWDALGALLGLAAAALPLRLAGRHAPAAPPAART